jgi:hypothetical protein
LGQQACISEARVKRGPSKRSSIKSTAKKARTRQSNEILEDDFSFALHEAELITACQTDDVKKIKGLLNEFPFLLDSEDDSGWTPLFHAVNNDKFNAVKTLINLRANVNLSDNCGCLLMDYVSDPTIKRFLLNKGADVNAARLHDIHKAAAAGDIVKIQQILSKDSTKLNVVDDNGWSPLYWAAYNQHQHVVEYLLDNGAETELAVEGQFNLIDCTELENGPTPLSAYLKERIGFSSKELDKIVQSFQSLVEEQLSIAKLSNKNILIMFAELHGNYKIYQLQKKLLSILNNLGINIYLDESHVKDESQYPIVVYAKNRRGMTVIPVDNHPLREQVSVQERNVVMAKEISSVDQHAFLVTGAEHVYGFFAQENSQIDRNKFHIVPINLTSIVTSYQSASPEIFFVKDPRNVIQIENSAFTQSKKVIEKWNSGEEFALKKPKIITPLLKNIQKRNKTSLAPTSIAKDRKSEKVIKSRKWSH